jgi:hypothetical protein
VVVKPFFTYVYGTGVRCGFFATENVRSRYNHSGLGAYPPISRQNFDPWKGVT